MSILIDLKPTMLHPSVENGWTQLKLSFRDWETVLTQFSTHLLVFSWYSEQWRGIGWKWKIWNIWSIMDNLVGTGKFDQNWWPCWVLWPWVEHINLKDCLKNLKTCFTKTKLKHYFEVCKLQRSVFFHHLSLWWIEANLFCQVLLAGCDMCLQVVYISPFISHLWWCYCQLQ